jgi:hypothetical protein
MRRSGLLDSGDIVHEFLILNSKFLIAVARASRHASHLFVVSGEL